MFSQKTKDVFVLKGKTREYRKVHVGNIIRIRNLFLEENSILSLSGCILYVEGNISSHKTSKIRLFNGSEIFYYGKSKLKHPKVNRVKSKIKIIK